MSENLITKCPSCGAKNRVAGEKLASGLVPRCARCKTLLPVVAGGDGSVMTVTDETFHTKIECSERPVLLDLWAPWCGPCRMIAPVFEELAQEMGNQVLFAKLNIDENPRTAAQFHVSSIPTMLLLKSGREVDRIIGLQPKEELQRRIARSIA